MKDNIDRKLRVGLPGAPGLAKSTIQGSHARAGAIRRKLASAASLIFAAVSAAYPAWAQVPPEPAPQGSATVTQGGSVTAPGAIVRTPEDIERDRNIVPHGNEPREVPNPPTVPLEKYRKSKQGSAESTPGSEKGGPAQK